MSSADSATTPNGGTARAAQPVSGCNTRLRRGAARRCCRFWPEPDEADSGESGSGTMLRRLPRAPEEEALDGDVVCDILIGHPQGHRHQGAAVRSRKIAPHSRRANRAGAVDSAARTSSRACCGSTISSASRRTLGAHRRIHDGLWPEGSTGRTHMRQSFFSGRGAPRIPMDGPPWDLCGSFRVRLAKMDLFGAQGRHGFPQASVAPSAVDCPIRVARTQGAHKKMGCFGARGRHIFLCGIFVGPSAADSRVGDAMIVRPVPTAYRAHARKWFFFGGGAPCAGATSTSLSLLMPLVPAPALNDPTHLGGRASRGPARLRPLSAFQVPRPPSRGSARGPRRFDAGLRSQCPRTGPSTEARFAPFPFFTAH